MTNDGLKVWAELTNCMAGNDFVTSHLLIERLLTYFIA